MKGSHPHPVYSRDATVTLVTGQEKIDTFHRAVERSGFLPHLLSAWEQSGRAKEEFLIAIKPNFMVSSAYQKDSPVYTDPELVEALIGLMRDEGFARFVVVETENVFNYSYTGRRVRAVAEMCGFGGDGYEILDLSEDTVEVDYGGALGTHRAGRAWLEAGYRISFAKNKTNWQCYYTACIKNVFGCLPEWDKLLHYHGRNIEFFQATIQMAEKIPVHFGFLDAWTSGDGLSGHVRDAQPNQTRTIAASDNIYALDWVAGEKMQIEPLDCTVLKEARSRWGSINITRDGDMTPWHPWNNIRPIVVALANGSEEVRWLIKTMSRSMASQMDPRFPPVRKGQWFFGIIQAVVRFSEGLGTKQVEARSEPFIRD
jgi:uncharacterized protein (DUF362 family)